MPSTPPPPHSHDGQGRLIFPQSSDKVGRPFAIAEHARASAETACRELIQNALDAHAARQTADEGSCTVTFKVKKIQTAEIPGFDNYRWAIERCLNVWRSEKEVSSYLEGMAELVNRDHVDVLYVIDNGIGFTPESLEAVLNEGNPQKQPGAAGAFGIGHLTTFGLSGLQYVFYAGKGSEGHKSASGHAILSSFNGEDGTLCSHHGYYVAHYQNDFFNRFQFCKTIPKDIKQQLSKIENTGSVIAAYGFNYFREDDDLNDSDLANNMIGHIRNAVANNFALAIISGQLNVKIQHYAADEQIIEAASIQSFLENAASDDQDHDSSKNAQLTLDTIETFRHNESVHDNLTGKFQDCKLILKNRTARHSISIWRNGMHITRKHLGLSRRWFGNKKFFNCIVSLSGKSRPHSHAHDLIKNAESPLHDRIERQRLKVNERKELASLLKEIREWILEHATDSGGESLDLMDDILLGSGTAAEARVHRRPERIIDDASGHEAPAPSEEDGKGSKRNGGGSRAGARGKTAVTSKNNVNARVQGKTMNNGLYRVRLVPHKNIRSGVVNLLIDSGQDPSCTGRIKEQDVYIQSAQTEDGGHLSVKDLSILVNNLRADEPVVIDCTLNLPRDVVQNVSIVCLLGEIGKETFQPQQGADK